MAEPMNIAAARRERHRAEMHTRIRSMSSFFRANDPPMQFCQELMGWVDCVSDQLAALEDGAAFPPFLSETVAGETQGPNVVTLNGRGAE